MWERRWRKDEPLWKVMINYLLSRQGTGNYNSRPVLSRSNAENAGKRKYHCVCGESEKDSHALSRSAREERMLCSKGMLRIRVRAAISQRSPASLTRCGNLLNKHVALHETLAVCKDEFPPTRFARPFLAVTKNITSIAKVVGESQSGAVWYPLISVRPPRRRKIEKYRIHCYKWQLPHSRETFGNLSCNIHLDKCFVLHFKICVVRKTKWQESSSLRFHV